MSNIVFFLYADNPTIVNGGKVNDMSAVRNTDFTDFWSRRKAEDSFLYMKKA